MSVITPNERAFLSLIDRSEGSSSRGGDPYRVCYGFVHTIADLRDHPAITGEWRGEPLTDQQCIGAGLSPGCVSTAAGRYQITRPTWRTLRTALALFDFTAPSQDRAALELIRQRGAADDVRAGRVPQAVARLWPVWASLPGASFAGQNTRPLQFLLAAYQAAGGALA